MSNNSNNCSGGSIAAGGGGAGGVVPISPGQTYTWTINGGAWTVFPQPVIEEVKPAEAKKQNKDGCNCKKCKEHYPYAEPNQDDGTFSCYRCRKGY